MWYNINGGNMLLKEYIENGNYNNIFEGKNVILNEEEIMVGINKSEIETGNKILLTQHFIIVLQY